MVWLGFVLEFGEAAEQKVRVADAPAERDECPVICADSASVTP